MGPRKVVQSCWKSTSIESTHLNDKEQGQDKPVVAFSNEVDPSVKSSSKEQTLQRVNTSHLDLVAELSLFHCPNCDKEYTTNHSLIRHMRWHNGENPFKCNICEVSFYRPDILRSHELEHMQSKLVCRYCKDEFPTVNLRRTHFEHVHAKAKKKKPTITASSVSSTACTDQKEFSKTDLSNAHVATHESPKNMNDAQRKTNDDDDEIVSRQHEAASTPKRFKCDICSREFKTKSAYNSHCKAHQRKYSCEYCGRNMANSTSLKRHILIHTRQKPFQCEICENKFRRNDLLKAHLRTHVKHKLKPILNKPHNCDFCDRRYAQRFSLFRHMKADHPQVDINPMMQRLRNKDLKKQRETEVKSSVKNIPKPRSRAVNLKKQSLVQKARMSTYNKKNNIPGSNAMRKKTIPKNNLLPSLPLHQKPLPQPTNVREKVGTKDEDVLPAKRKTPMGKTMGSPPPPQLQMTKEPEQRKQCKLCREEMGTDHDLTVHTLAFHSLKSHGKVCGICQKPCPSLHVLSRHYEYFHSGDKNAAKEAKILLNNSNCGSTIISSPALVDVKMKEDDRTSTSH